MCFHSAIMIQLYIHRSSFLHGLGMSALKLVPLQLAHLKISGCAEFGALNTKESDFSPECVFTEMDHHTAVIDTTWLDRMRDNDEEAISSEVTSTDSATVQCSSDSDAESEDFSEVIVNENHIVDMETMLDNYDPTVPTCDELLSPQEITFVPGEGQIPLSVFNDDNAEYLSFQPFFVDKRGQI